VTETKETLSVEDLDRAGEVGQAPDQPVGLVGHDHIDLIGAHIPEQPLPSGPL